MTNPTTPPVPANHSDEIEWSEKRTLTAAKARKDEVLDELSLLLTSPEIERGSIRVLAQNIVRETSESYTNTLVAAHVNGDYYSCITADGESFYTTGNNDVAYMLVAPEDADPLRCAWKETNVSHDVTSYDLLLAYQWGQLAPAIALLPEDDAVAPRYINKVDVETSDKLFRVTYYAPGELAILTYDVRGADRKTIWVEVQLDEEDVESAFTWTPDMPEKWVTVDQAAKSI